MRLYDFLELGVGARIRHESGALATVQEVYPCERKLRISYDMQRDPALGGSIITEWDHREWQRLSAGQRRATLG